MYNHTEALIKIYFHAGKYAKITYKMSLLLSKIVFIQWFFSRNNNVCFV